MVEDRLYKNRVEATVIMDVHSLGCCEGNAEAVAEDIADDFIYQQLGNAQDEDVWVASWSVRCICCEPVEEESDEDDDWELIAELNSTIDAMLWEMFPSYVNEISDQIREDVIEDVKTSSDWPNYNGSDVSLAIQRSVLKKMGVSI